MAKYSQPPGGSRQTFCLNLFICLRLGLDSCGPAGHTAAMGIWSALWRRLRRRPKEEPQQPTHLGGRGIPHILGVCQVCGAVVVEGLHQATPTGFLCQRCATAARRRSP